MPPGPSTTRRDILSAYLASFTKIASWAAVSALVYRRLGPDAFALLALVRSTLGLLSYTSFGLGPALIHHLAKFPPLPRRQAQGFSPGSPPVAEPSRPQGGVGASPPRRPHSERSEESQPSDHQPASFAQGTEPDSASPGGSPRDPIPPRPPTSPLPYATGATPGPDTRPHSAQPAYTTGVVTAVLLFIAGLALLLTFASHTTHWLRVPDLFTDAAVTLVVTMGLGILARLLSEPAGALLQTFGRITADNLLLAAADLLWALLFALFIEGVGATIDAAGSAFLASALFLLLARYALSRRILPLSFSRPACGARLFDPRLARSLFSFGLLLTLAQLADFLYAPTDFLLINHLLSTRDLAAYAPCVQIDAALLVLVTGLSSVLLPKAALAHARNDTASLRRYYLQGTLLSTALLLLAALATWLAAPLLLRLWLHDIPPGTLHVLPLVLCHTVLGGSSAVGRSILLGSGKVKPFTTAVLLSGLANVALSYTLVRFTNLGLTGIVLGTLLAVTARCALWMPWYTLRTLRYPNS